MLSVLPTNVLEGNVLTKIIYRLRRKTRNKIHGKIFDSLANLVVSVHSSLNIYRNVTLKLAWSHIFFRPVSHPFPIPNSITTLSIEKKGKVNF